MREYFCFYVVTLQANQYLFRGSIQNSKLRWSTLEKQLEFLTIFEKKLLNL